MYDNGEKRSNDNDFIKVLKISKESISKMETIEKNGSFDDFKKIVNEGCINSIYYNAWEHDDEVDPIISITYDIIKNFELIDNTKKIDLDKHFDSFKELIKVVTLGKIQIGDSIKEKDLSNFIRNKYDIKDALTLTLNDVINENCNKLIIFIDELDRCKPDYAIRMLERLNHYFNNDRIIIVLSTNLIELSHTVSCIYGGDFSSEKYLDKFIDQRLFLPRVDVDKYIITLNMKILNYNNWTSNVIKQFIKYYKFDMRQINRYIGILRYFEKYFETNNFFTDDCSFTKYILIPYMIGLYCSFPSKYNTFIDGNGFPAFKNFIKSNSIIGAICCQILYNNKNDNNNSLFNDIEKIYNMAFSKDNENSIIIGENLQIWKSEFEDLYDTISLLGNVAFFENKDSN